MPQFERLKALCLPSEDPRYKLAIATYDYRRRYNINYGQDMAGTLFRCGEQTYVPRVAESQGRGVDLTRHSERLSFLRVIRSAISDQWGPFKDFSRNPSDIPDTLSIEMIQKDVELLNALNQLSYIDTYTDRSSCDYRNNDKFKNSSDQGCTPYFEQLASLLPNTKVENYHSIRKYATNEESKLALGTENSIIENLDTLILRKKKIVGEKEELLKNYNDEMSKIEIRLAENRRQYNGPTTSNEEKPKIMEAIKNIQTQDMQSLKQKIREKHRELNTSEASINKLLEANIQLSQKLEEISKEKETLDEELKREMLKLEVQLTEKRRQYNDPAASNEEKPKIMEAIKNIQTQDMQILKQKIRERKETLSTTEEKIRTQLKENLDLFSKTSSSSSSAMPSSSFSLSSSSIPDSSSSSSSSDVSLSSLTDDELNRLNEEAINESKKMAKDHNIGPRILHGWDLQDVEDDGNCFYAAVADQLTQLQHDFIKTIPDGTEPYNALRLRVQGKHFRDGEWADHPEILNLSRKIGVVIAIADTRTPDKFVYHYVDSNNRENHTMDATLLPDGMPIVKIAYTGNHYLSVISHPTLSNIQAASLPNAVIQQDLSSNLSSLKKYPITSSSFVKTDSDDIEATSLQHHSSSSSTVSLQPPAPLHHHAPKPSPFSSSSSSIKQGNDDTVQEIPPSQQHSNSSSSVSNLFPLKTNNFMAQQSQHSKPSLWQKIKATVKKRRHTPSPPNTPPVASTQSSPSMNASMPATTTTRLLIVQQWNTEEASSAAINPNLIRRLGTSHTQLEQNQTSLSSSSNSANLTAAFDSEKMNAQKFASQVKKAKTQETQDLSSNESNNRSNFQPPKPDHP